MERWTLVIVGALLLASCGGSSGSDATSPAQPELTAKATTSASTSTTTTRSSVPAPTSALPKTPPTTPIIARPEPGPIDTGLVPIIELAVSDLSERLGISQEEIVAITGQLVVWPDASLGCPEPGMFYAQVLTDGSLIVLEAEGIIYRYHAAAGDVRPFLCETPG